MGHRDRSTTRTRRWLTSVIMCVSMVTWTGGTAQVGQAMANDSTEQAEADATQSLDHIKVILDEHIYDRRALRTPAYHQIEAEMEALARTAPDSQTFVEGIEALWDEGPFSHVDLRRARRSAQELGPRFDAMQLGDGIVSLQWQGSTAVLTINSLMGADTVVALEAAYDEIAERGADHLIVDLRENVGGPTPWSCSWAI